MKKKVLLFSILFLVLILPAIFAAANDTDLSDDEKVNQAYDCLQNKIEDKECDNLGFEEKVFSVLATGECLDELMDDGSNDECWPDNGCTLKSTAQAALALESEGEDTDDAVDWLFDQKMSPTDITWYLQIESPEETRCKISYDSNHYEIIINKEKQISVGAGSCLALSEGKWWLRIAPSCYGKDIRVSCDKRFLTNLLFKKQDSTIIHVSEKTTESSSGGENTERVDSFCFGQAGRCNYEGSLWAATALDFLDEDIDPYLPYLITLSEDDANSKFLSESFLFYITDSYDFRNSLLAKQKANKYWDESGDKFYDTAVALLSIKDDPSEKTSAKRWLLDNKTRDSEGCWKGSISATGFILYSIWPRAHSGGGGGGGGGTPGLSCSSHSGFCLSSTACSGAGGSQLNFDCAGMSVCCNKNKLLESCFNQGGEVCNSDKFCSGGTTVEASDVESGEECCIGGICTISIEQSECVAAAGTCRTSCNDGEVELDQSCDSFSDVCCAEEGNSFTGKNYLWIWILSLAILIVLVVMGFLYKDKLKAYWVSFTGKGKSSSQPRGGPFMPPSFPSFPPRGLPPRRIIPSSTPVPQRRPMPVKKTNEMDDVLKKLKDMGK